MDVSVSGLQNPFAFFSSLSELVSVHRVSNIEVRTLCWYMCLRVVLLLFVEERARFTCVVLRFLFPSRAAVSIHIFSFTAICSSH